MVPSRIRDRLPDGRRGVAAHEDRAGTVVGVTGVLSPAHAARSAGHDLAAAARGAWFGGPVDLGAATLLPSIDHPDPAHPLASGTGLAPLGSALANAFSAAAAVRSLRP